MKRLFRSGNHRFIFRPGTTADRETLLPDFHWHGFVNHCHQVLEARSHAGFGIPQSSRVNLEQVESWGLREGGVDAYNELLAYLSDQKDPLS